MFGTLRLVLALLVIAAHCELPHQVNPGVSAVVVFFLLSGFVMTATLRRYYPSWRNYGAFVFDRAARILPQYLFWLGVALAWLLMFAAGQKAVAWQPVAENISLLPLMFVVYDLKPWVSGVIYLTQCWSLSLEVYFYLVLPALLLVRWGRAIVYLLSFAVAALAALNWINPYNYGYHLLPGVMFIFLIGSIIFDESQVGATPRKTIGAFAMVLFLGLIANSQKSLDHEWTRELLLGLFAGIPMVFFLARLNAAKWDNALGNLSYGVFLNHYVILDSIHRYHLLRNPWLIFITTVALSIPLSWLSYRLVEVPFLRFRRRLRDLQSKSMN